MNNVKSMTGYGREAFSVGNADFSVEISSVNQRGLAISVSAPQEWMPAAERLLAPLVRARVARGKITLALRLGGGKNGASAETFSWDETAVAETIAKMRNAACRAGIDFSPDAALYLHLAELHRARAATLPSIEDESVVSAVSDATERALAAFVAMREREGANLESDLRERLARLRAWADGIREASAGTVAHSRDALRARLAALGLEIDPDDPRFLKEIAFFADRCDISEELTRLASHFAQFENALAEAECGRKLDFICQEILREFNTIGSKANDAAITRRVVEAKNEQERLREQVQNIE